MIEFTRRKRTGSSLNMAPLIDIVFLLLIFFLLTSVFINDPGLDLALPEAKTSDRLEPEEIVVYITKEGELYINVEPVSWEDLETRLQESLASGSKKTLVVKADKDVPFSWFVRVMDISRQAGALDLIISTDIPLDSG